MIATIFGRKATVCGPSCREGFRADRRAGLIYRAGAVLSPSGAVVLSDSRESWSMDTGRCAYCSAETVHAREVA